jgi:hypothetical protein
MTLEAKGRLLESGPSRTVVYVSQEVASDSQFPFERGQDLWLRIEPEEGRLVVEAYGGRDRT